jgi:hypothetical protein
MVLHIHLVILLQYIYGGGDIRLEKLGSNDWTTGTNTPTDGASHNYMLCKTGATYDVYLDNIDIYSKTFSTNYSTTYPFLGGNLRETYKNFYAYDSEPTPTPTPTPTPSLVSAINTGGDTQGNFIADTDNSGGQTYSSTATVNTSNVTNPAPQAVYQSVRYGNFTYTVPNLSPNTTYTVKLHFNELYWGTDLASGAGGIGSRVFNASINGQQVLTNYDIFQDAGGANIAVVKPFTTTSDANGKITIQFSTVTDNAMVNGIEITQ